MINDEKLTANALTDEELEYVTGGRPPASIPSIVVATAPVLLKLYDQTNGQSIPDNDDPNPEAYGPAGLPPMSE